VHESRGCAKLGRPVCFNPAQRQTWTAVFDVSPSGFQTTGCPRLPLYGGMRASSGTSATRNPAGSSRRAAATARPAEIARVVAFLASDDAALSADRPRRPDVVGTDA